MTTIAKAIAADMAENPDKWTDTIGGFRRCFDPQVVDVTSFAHAGVFVDNVIVDEKSAIVLRSAMDDLRGYKQGKRLNDLRKALGYPEL